MQVIQLLLRKEMQKKKLKPPRVNLQLSLLEKYWKMVKQTISHSEQNQLVLGPQNKGTPNVLDLSFPLKLSVSPFKGTRPASTATRSLDLKNMKVGTAFNKRTVVFLIWILHLVIFGKRETAMLSRWGKPATRKGFQARTDEEHLARDFQDSFAGASSSPDLFNCLQEAYRVWRKRIHLIICRRQYLAYINLIVAGSNEERQCPQLLQRFASARL